MRLAYVDWMIPQTAVKVRMGRQGVGLPADAFGKSAIMDATWGTRDGVSLSAPVADWMNLSAFWVRVVSIIFYKGVPLHCSAGNIFLFP